MITVASVQSPSSLLSTPVIHGYVQSAATVAANTVPLRKELDGVAKLHYVDGPPMSRGVGSRPWWILDNNLEHNSSSGRWEESVRVTLLHETAYMNMFHQIGEMVV